MNSNDVLCDDCQVLFSTKSFNLAYGMDGVVSAYTRPDQLPALPTLTRAADSGCTFCVVLWRCISSRVFPKYVKEICIGPPVLSMETSGVGFLGDEKDRVYALGIPVSSATGMCFELRFSLFSEPDSKASQYLRIHRRPPSSNRTSNACILRLQKWIMECYNHHWECSPGTEHFTPTRVIDVGPPDGCVEPKLVMTKGTALKYVALSHCWGPPNSASRMLKTETCSLDAHMREIPLRSMPTSFQDAIIMTRSLNLRYLWIDSLCIIQDSVEDWAYEASQMASVYSYAFVTLAATAAKSCQDGFLAYPVPDQIFTIPFTCAVANTTRKIPSKQSINQQIVLQRIEDEDGIGCNDDVEHSTWNSRGWTLQERYLSRRVIHFSKSQIFWECRKESKSECGQPIFSLPLSVKKYGPEISIDGEVLSKKTRDCEREDDDNSWEQIIADARPENPQDSNQGTTKRKWLVPNLYSWWFGIIQKYTNRELTSPSDKLPALNGLVAEMSSLISRYNNCNAEYLAGLWSSAIADCLLWRPRDPAQTTCVRPYRAPTWSWARYDGPIMPCALHINDDNTGNLIFVRNTITYISHCIQYERANCFGSMICGALKLRATIRVINLSSYVEVPPGPLGGHCEMLEVGSLKVVGVAAMDQAPRSHDWVDAKLYGMQVNKQGIGEFSKQTMVSQSGLILRLVESEDLQFQRIGVYVLNEENLDFFDTIEPEEIVLV